MATALTASRRRFLRRAAAGTAAGFAFGLIPWEEVLARAARFGIVPGTLVDAQGRALGTATGGSDPFVGEIILTPYTFAPYRYATCDGQLLPISQNTALFSLLGTTYGGNGQTTFALPDLRGCVPRGVGQGPGLAEVVQGEQGGQEAVTLTAAQMPAHTHPGLVVGSGRRSRTLGTTSLPSAVLDENAYGTSADQPGAATSATGGSQPMPNLPPYLALNFCISLSGIYPQRP